VNKGERTYYRIVTIPGVMIGATFASQAFTLSN